MALGSLALGSLGDTRTRSRARARRSLYACPCIHTSDPSFAYICVIVEDAVLLDKITKMQNQKEVAQSRLVILNDRLAKHEHEMKCREHDATAAGGLSENCV